MTNTQQARGIEPARKARSKHCRENFTYIERAQPQLFPAPGLRCQGRQIRGEHPEALICQAFRKITVDIAIPAGPTNQQDEGKASLQRLSIGCCARWIKIEIGGHWFCWKSGIPDGRPGLPSFYQPDAFCYANMHQFHT